MSPAHGKMNVGWGINNLLYEAAPTKLHYYYETASNCAEGKDYFVVGPHFAYASYFHDTLPSYTEHENIKGLFYIEYCKYDYWQDGFSGQTASRSSL